MSVRGRSGTLSGNTELVSPQSLALIRQILQLIGKRLPPKHLTLSEVLDNSDLCLPRGVINLLIDYDKEIPLFWKVVLHSISEHLLAVQCQQNIVSHALAIYVVNSNPDATDEERAAIINDLIQRATIETQRADLEETLKRN